MISIDGILLSGKKVCHTFKDDQVLFDHYEKECGNMASVTQQAGQVIFLR